MTFDLILCGCRISIINDFLASYFKMFWSYIHMVIYLWNSLFLLADIFGQKITLVVS